MRVPSFPPSSENKVNSYSNQLKLSWVCKLEWSLTKKIDKKTGCTDNKTADKSKNNVGTVDENQNILEKPIKFIQKSDGLSGTNLDLSICSYLSPARRCTPVSRPPCSPQSPHTPPGLPPSDSFHSEPQCESSLSGYFTNPAPARDQGKGSTDSGPVLMADYIGNTSLVAPGALAHRLQRHTACKIQYGCQGAPKWPTGSGKVSTPRLLGVLSNFR